MLNTITDGYNNFINFIWLQSITFITAILFIFFSNNHNLKDLNFLKINNTLLLILWNLAMLPPSALFFLKIQFLSFSFSNVNLIIFIFLLINTPVFFFYFFLFFNNKNKNNLLKTYDISLSFQYNLFWLLVFIVFFPLISFVY